ncbi:MAG: sensor histidine kinase [Planctomycetota bacterium]|jgi:signal transduction histidine kinase
MNKRFWIICSVIGLGLLTLSVLGLSSLGMHRKGLEAERQQEFMDVAKRISFDVKKKVDIFLQAEQNRPYTDYQLYYVPETGNQAAALVQSPLANSFSNSFANGYFQLDSVGQVTSPHFSEQQIQLAKQQVQRSKRPADHSEYFDNIRQNLLPSLQNGQTVATHRVEPTKPQEKEYDYSFDRVSLRTGRRARSISAPVPLEESPQVAVKIPEEQVVKGAESKKQSGSKSTKSSSRRNVYPISTLEKNQQTTQVVRQRRDNYEMNVISNDAVQVDDSVSQAVQTYNRSRIQSDEMPAQQDSSQPKVRQQSSSSFSQKAEKETENLDGAILDEQADFEDMREGSEHLMQQQERFVGKKDNNMPMRAPGMDGIAQTQTGMMSEFGSMDQLQAQQPDTVQVRIEPFVPMTVSASNNNNGIFAGQVYLLRHVQIEDRHLVQGFQLNEDELLMQVADSAKKLLRRGMGYEISKFERPDAAFAAILQFDFGEVVLNLLEQEPGLIQARVVYIRNWFFGILGVVWLAVLVAMMALWKNLNEQIQLSRKKDDFISAVSHELRTPLTSIRMYTEMLEKDWVKTDDKRREYYTTMRTESERLTRLIENVLDFSRIQRGKKRYDFTVGDVNECIGDVTDMMRPYARRAGFVLEQRFEVLDAFAFDRDAVTQIVINLVDNALKYAKDAQDKHIIIRTRKQKDYAVIEVEDHGPGIPRSQQKKIFDAFYRCEDESTGTGLGLALVKRFAEAHRGFVEIANAKPAGALFRVGLTTARSASAGMQ